MWSDRPHFLENQSLNDAQKVWSVEPQSQAGQLHETSIPESIHFNSLLCLHSSALHLISVMPPFAEHPQEFTMLPEFLKVSQQVAFAVVASFPPMLILFAVHFALL